MPSISALQNRVDSATARLDSILAAAERRELLNGSQMFAISGRVSNPTNERQRVPDIRVELKDAQSRVVYGWTIRPEATSLAPRGSVEVNSAKLDVPVNSKNMVLSFSNEVDS